MRILVLLLPVMLNASNSEETSLTIPGQTTPTRELANALVLRYFKNNQPEIVDQVRPYLERKLEDPWHAKRTRKLAAVVETDPDSDDSSKEIKRAALRVIVAAMEDALKEQTERVDVLATVQDQSLTKKQALIITSMVSIVTALIGAGITFAGTFSAC